MAPSNDNASAASRCDDARISHRHQPCSSTTAARYRLHYVTAYDMAMLVKAAEAGLEGSPRELMQHKLL